MPPRPFLAGLYCEGKSDRHFLPIIIRRTTEMILTTKSTEIIDIMDVYVVNDDMMPRKSSPQKILEAARCALECDLLCIHRDADHPTRAHAIKRYFEPGINLVQQSLDPVCKRMIPIIPIRNVEAWMLVDAQALLKAIGSNIRTDHLGLPNAPNQVESIQDTKQRLKQAVQQALSSRRHNRREMAIDDLYSGLADEIELDRLLQVSAYQDFRNDLHNALISIGMARR